MSQYDVYGLGNALVDMEYRVDDGFLGKHGIAKGHMTLVDEERLNALVAALSDYEPERMSGGSAANTMIAVQGFGNVGSYSAQFWDERGGKVVAEVPPEKIVKTRRKSETARLLKPFLAERWFPSN